MKVMYKIDPTGHFTNHIEDTEALQEAENDIIEACGLVAYWAISDDIDLPMLKMLEYNYHFPVPDLKGATLTDNAIWQYPGDPDLYPLIEIARGDEMLYIYQHALIAILQKDGSLFCSRMD